MILVNRPFSAILTGDDRSQESLKTAIAQSLEYLKKIPPETSFQYGKLIYSSVELMASFKIFLTILNKDYKYDRLLSELETGFYLFRSSSNPDKQVLFTGYYEPLFKGSLVRTKEYNVPVYSLPEDLKVLNLGKFRGSLKNRTIVYHVKNNRIARYYDRKEIMANRVLANKKYEIAWMKDPVDLFFMQVQGSGILLLPDGKKIKLAYNGSNGRHYSSIGKYLVGRGQNGTAGMSQ